MRANPRRRIFHALFLVILTTITAGVPSSPTTSTVAAASPTAFASPLFQQLWERTDGPVASGHAARSWLWGPAPGQPLTERAPSGPAIEVQYFDKARMELNPAVTDPTSQWRVTTGLLVAELSGLSGSPPGNPASLVVAGDAVAANPRYSDFYPHLLARASDATGKIANLALPTRGQPQPAPSSTVRYSIYITPTGHNIPDVFWDYLHSEGPVQQPGGELLIEPLFDWLYVMGYPISEPYWATLVIDARPQLALIQLYQRRVLTYVPAFPTGWQVQMGNVGATYYQWRYTSTPATPVPPTPPALPPLTSPGGGFVGLSGDAFTYRGDTVVLKGTNYWLSAAPFADTWAEWNGPHVLAELARARDLGVNTVRIGLPYDNEETFDVVWGTDESMTTVSPWIKSQMTQLLQIASGYGMKVIFILFDWYDDHPPLGTPQERSNFAYLDGIVGAFAHDDRVLAWDLSNEPDVYEEWKAGRQSDYIDWLRRMAVRVRQLDPRHPVTVGVGDYRSLWYEADNGDTILDISDFVSFHCYDAGNLASQVAEIKTRTAKPILLGEMGWPTSTGGEPPRPGATFDEPTQDYLYTTMLAQAKTARIGGVLQWTLFDFDESKAHLVVGFERYFGLFRRDGTPKPAAAIFQQNYTAPLLPSDTKTNIPLDTSDHPRTRP
jgi:Cellulase (glycosyl hydrolase family 5)